MPDHAVQARLRIADLLELLVGPQRRVVTLGKDDCGDYSGSASDHTRARHSASSTLEGMLDGLTDVPRVKVCLRCEVAKRIGGYGPDRDSADGLASTCKACEAKRIGAIGKRKKGRQ